MQSVSNDFRLDTQRGLRPLRYNCFMSFTKAFDSSTTFMTVGSSYIGHSDILKGASGVLQEWDKYHYDDYSGRVLQIDYDREASANIETPVILATADITLDNSDGYFTPTNTSSKIYGNVRPQRPVKLYVGFRNATVPVFVGVTVGMPEIDEVAKTARFHCLDFFQSLANTSLDQDVIYTNKSTDTIIGNLLTSAGLSSSQYSLDAGTVIIPFAYFPKGSKLGDVLRDMTQAELGRIYMSETGVITFENRTNWLTSHNVSQWHFDGSNTLDKTSPSTDSLVNVVEVTSNARSLVSGQQLWTSSDSYAVPAGSSLDIFADFTDNFGALPVTHVDLPLYYTSATTSQYQTNLQSDGSGDPGNSYIGLSAVQLFSTSYKMTFTNSNTQPVYITSISLFGSAGIVTQTLYSRVTDASSIALYDEQPVSFENDYIQTQSAANTIGQLIVNDSSQQQQELDLTVVGVPQLQVGDLVNYNDRRTNSTFYVSRINGVLDTTGFQQNITIRTRTISVYFRIGISTIGGTDGISP